MTEESNSSKVVRVPITHMAFENLFRNRNAILIERGLPKNAKVVAVHNDLERLMIYVVFQHRSFQTVLVGETIPIFEITVRDLNEVNIYK